MGMFLRLLDPRSPLHPGEQQLIAANEFPKLVAKTQLHYWSPNQPVTDKGVRILIGLQASFNLPDLRLADVINECLTKQPRDDVRIDIFNSQDDQEFCRDPKKYYPKNPDVVPSPYVGIWNNGRFIGIWFGSDAIEKLIEILDLPRAELSVPLRPPFEDRLF